MTEEKNKPIEPFYCPTIKRICTKIYPIDDLLYGQVECIYCPIDSRKKSDALFEKLNELFGMGVTQAITGMMTQGMGSMGLDLKVPQTKFDDHAFYRCKECKARYVQIKTDDPFPCFRCGGELQEVDSWEEKDPWWPEFILCTECGNKIEITEEPKSVDIKCPHCGHETVITRER